MYSEVLSKNVVIQTLWNKNDQEIFQTRRNKKPTNGKILLKLYYGAEIWHIPGLTLALKKNLKFVSGKFLGTVIMKKAVILNEQSL